MDAVEYRELLNVGTYKVLFTKKDGSIREMVATTDPRIIGEEFFAFPPLPTEMVHPTQVRCYDLDAEGWRSFSAESVLEWKLFS